MKLRVVGLGSPSGGDDQAGLLAAARLRASLPPVVEVTSDTTGGARLSEFAEDVDTLILLDALSATREWPVGTPSRWLYPQDRHRLQSIPLSNSHSVSVVQGLELLRALGRLPRLVLIHALAVAHFKPGTPFSPSLEQPLQRWIEIIHRDARRLLSRPPHRESGSQSPVLQRPLSHPAPQGLFPSPPAASESTFTPCRFTLPSEDHPG